MKNSSTIRTQVGACIILVLWVGLPSLFTRDLWNPDEPRYMEVAREMFDYDPPLTLLVPHLNGEIYAEKPPLFFWLTGILWKSGLGVNSGRAVTLAAVLGILLLVSRFCQATWNKRVGLLSACISITTLLLFAFTRRGVIDPLLALFVSVSVLYGYRAFHEQGRARRASWLICYAAMGLGILAKGPVAFAVPALVLITYRITGRAESPRGIAPHFLGAVLMLLVVLVWLIPAVILGGADYARTIVFKQTFGRTLQSFSHARPPYYYLLQTPPFLVPWLFILPTAVVAVIRERKNKSADLAFLSLLWFAVPLVFFSFVSGKRLNYVLPIAPAVGILCAWYITCSSERKGTILAFEKWLVNIAFILLGLAIVVVGVALFFTDSILEAVATRVANMVVVREAAAAFLGFPGLLAAEAMLLPPMALVLVGLRADPRNGVERALALGGIVLLLSAPIDLVATPIINSTKSGRQFAQRVKKEAGHATRLYMYKKNFSGVYNLYSGYMRIPVIESPGELRDLLGLPDVLVIADSKDLERRPEERAAPTLSPPELERYTIHMEHIGHRKMLILKSIPVIDGSRLKAPIPNPKE